MGDGLMDVGKVKKGEEGGVERGDNTVPGRVSCLDQFEVGNRNTVMEGEKVNQSGGHGGYGYKSPSPSVFPSSPFLVSQLQRLPHPQPPARATGVGIAVQPTFDMDGLNSPTSGLSSTRGRSQSSLRTNSYASPTTRSRLARKTSSDSINTSPSTSTFGGDQVDEESEFQRELRKAREELDMLAVKEMRDKEMLGRGRATVVSTPSRPPFDLAGDRPSRTAPVVPSLVADRTTSRSAAFFETTIQPLRPPGKVDTLPVGSRLLHARSASTESSDTIKSPPVAISRIITCPTPIPALTPASTGSVIQRRTPLASLHVPATAFVGLTPLHSPLPERDPSPMATADEFPINRPITPADDSYHHIGPPTPDKSNGRLIYHHTLSPAPRYEAGSPVVTPRAIQPPQIIATRSTFFDAHSPIKAPFARSTPEIEVSR